MNLKGRNFLTLKDFTPEEILYLLDLSADLKAKKKAGELTEYYKGKNIAQFTSPELTTIHQPVEQMAEMAVSAIVQIDAGKMVPTKTVFPVTLVERGTT